MTMASRSGTTSEVKKEKVIKNKKPVCVTVECPKCGRKLTMHRGKKVKCPYCRGVKDFDGKWIKK
jgi:Zn finger protein HypA/HybF involved in hydrogenase expression